MKSWFISDLHLKDDNERNSQILLRFLLHLGENPQEHQLFLLGDVFDFWLSNGKAFERQYRRVVDGLVAFKKKGGQVYYFEGNHDFHVDVYWTKKFQIPVVDNEAFFQIGDYYTRLEHGDFINPADHKYLAYRASVRRPWVEFIGHLIPGFFMKWFGETMSAKSRKKSVSYSQHKSVEIKDMIRRHAETVYDQEPFDLIITGHMHVEDDYTFNKAGKAVRSINLGTWLNRPVALKIENEKIDWIDLSSW